MAISPTLLAAKQVLAEEKAGNMVRVSKIESANEIIERFWPGTSEPGGMWLGRGANDLGLTAPIDPTELRNLLEGLTPEGNPAFAHPADRPSRKPGMEIVFTAPKSVSTLWALAPDYYAHKIRGCTRSAAEAATFHVEKALNWDPHDGQDSSSTRKAAVFALIHEDASREDNPDLHTHVLACNFDGRMDQMNHHTMTRIQAHASFTYDRYLRSRLEHLLGYTTESEQGGFRIKGVPKHICDHFSKPAHALLLFPGDRHQFWKETASRAGWGERDAEALIETTAQQKRFTEQFDTRRIQERLAGVLQRRSAGQPKVTHSKEGTESNQRSSEQQHQGQSH